ncbi:uncharacterized protein [Amphiura filiformis]|uniref:uncharacterized protein n=1 Tax=Amphiura filiformis TaxID=82378 RepID=UPI003B20EE8E
MGLPFGKSGKSVFNSPARSYERIPLLTVGHVVSMIITRIPSGDSMASVSISIAIFGCMEGPLTPTEPGPIKTTAIPGSPASSTSIVSGSPVGTGSTTVPGLSTVPGRVPTTGGQVTTASPGPTTSGQAPSCIEYMPDEGRNPIIKYSKGDVLNPGQTWTPNASVSADLIIEFPAPVQITSIRVTDDSPVTFTVSYKLAIEGADFVDYTDESGLPQVFTSPAGSFELISLPNVGHVITIIVTRIPSGDNLAPVSISTAVFGCMEGPTTPEASTVQGPSRTTGVPGNPTAGSSTVSGSPESPGSTPAVPGSSTNTTTEEHATSLPESYCRYQGVDLEYGTNLLLEDMCFKLACTKDLGISLTEIQCNLECDGGTLVYKADKCCPVCEYPEEVCKLESKTLTVNISGCKPDAPVDTRICAGFCHSGSNMNLYGMQDSVCACCQPELIETTTQIECDDGSFHAYSYNTAVGCNCRACREEHP